MMSMVRERVGVDFGVDHPLFAWSFVHAGWTRNRFAAVGGLTAYERATNARYNGRLVPFGEPVFGQITVKKKGNPRWVRCIFLSKTTTNDMYIVTTRAGVRLCRSVRRTTSSWMLDKPLYQGLAGFPWDYSAGAVGTRLVPPARARRPQLAPTLAPQVADEATSDPPTPVPGDVGSSPGPVGPGPAQPSSEGAAVSVQPSVPPDGAVLAENPVVPLSAGPNPALGQIDVEMLRTPEAMLPPLGDTAQGSAGSRDGPPEAGGDRKRIRIRAVQFGSYNLDYHDEDVSLDYPELECGELCEQVEAEIESEVATAGEDVVSEGTAAPNVQGPLSDYEQLQELLWYPDDGTGPPKLSDFELGKIDSVADEVEISRLSQKQVIRPVRGDEETQGMKRLSTKMVRSWRSKRKGGKAMWLRRSRLVAREYRWLEATREGLFSPSTSNSVVRLIPLLFLMWRMTRPGTVFALAAIDIKDAYLEVPQVEPVLADLPRDYSGSGRYIFLRCIPGQRDGAQRWFDFYVNFLHEGLTLETCTATVEIAYRVGDQISFLKRVHTLTETGMKIAISDQYARSMAKILEIRGGTAQTPDLAEFSGHDTSQVLSEQQASKYRSVIGIALYISADRPDIAHSVRKLSAVMTRPTALAWRAAIRLTQYMLATSSYALHLEPGEPGTSMLHGCVSAGSDLVECFTDADWSGSKADRKSIGSATHCINGAVVYFATRTQRSVSLSSMESEWYACVSGCCDALFIREVWEFISGQSAVMHVLLDNQSARALAKHQGAAKQAKHIAGRLLWIQGYVKRQVFKVMPVSSAYNLGDIGTKALAKARLRSLMYMHNFIDASSDERIGKFEYEQMQQQEYVKAQIKRVKKSVNTSTKLHSNIFMVMCNLMPLLTDATKLSSPTVSGGYASYMFPLCMVLLVALFAARALGLNDFSTLRLSIDFQYAPQALDVNGYVMQCFAFAFMLIGFMQGVSAEQYASLALMITCGALWNENRKLRAQCVVVHSRPHEGPLVAHGGRVLENPAALVVQVPEEVFVTTRGVCFHKGTCGHVRGKAPRSVRRCLDCFG
ncbi:unnamed protein product [Symbiodinium sp. CCMP2592]|nr:unnamed protein product [Symbiodinium sp. CCMP2592]